MLLPAERGFLIVIVMGSIDVFGGEPVTKIQDPVTPVGLVTDGFGLIGEVTAIDYRQFTPAFVQQQGNGLMDMACKDAENIGVVADQFFGFV